ncbi:Uncharacterised protein [uncultured archaeon]|nr:Uncharacterised protein [uncultured archaeon]
MDKSYVLMETVPGHTLNELAYRQPEVLEEDARAVAKQLGEYCAFSFVFGVRDGYQSNYIYDSKTKWLTRIDKENSLRVPTVIDVNGDEYWAYCREIAACELANLKYLPPFRRGGEEQRAIMRAFNTGFYEKHAYMKERRDQLIQYVNKARKAGAQYQPPADPSGYFLQTNIILNSVKALLDQNPEESLKHLYMAKMDLEKEGVMAFKKE